MKEIEDRLEDLGSFIREQRQLGRMSLRKLSEVAGISNPYLSQIVDPRLSEDQKQALLEVYRSFVRENGDEPAGGGEAPGAG